MVGKGAEEGRVEAKSETPNLNKYSRDLTVPAHQGKLDPVIGRAQEIETVIEILARRKKNNPVLIGEPGVRKTAIVEGLAQRMVAGTQYRGQFEERVKQLLDEVIVFHALDRDQLREIVGLQLERVKRIASAQGLTLEFDDTVVDHFSDVGYQPEFGARELSRQVRSQLETQLANAMLKGEISDGDTVRFFYDAARGIRWEKKGEVAASPVRERGGEAQPTAH